jgi:hypothetical protein
MVLPHYAKLNKRFIAINSTEKLLFQLENGDKLLRKADSMKHQIR